MSDKKTDEGKTENMEITLMEKDKKGKEKKPKKEKKPLDRAARKKRRRIITVVVIVLIAAAFVGKNLLSEEGPQAYVATASAVTGEIEQTINTSGTVTTEK